MSTSAPDRPPTEGTPSLASRARSALRTRTTLYLVAAVALAALGALTSTSAGALLSTITNPTDTAASTPYFTCKSAVVGATGQTAYFALPLAEALGATAADVSGNNRAGAYSLTGVTYAQPGPCPRDTPASRAVTLNGSSGSVSGANLLQAGPNTFSVEIWFQTTVAAGKLIGFGNSLAATSSSYDRHLYIDSLGRLEFGVYPNAVKTISTTTAVTDGKWHYAVATLSSSGQFLYLDGALAASNTAVTTGQTYSGYWRIGFDNLNGWTNQPTSAYFNGSLAWASVYLYALTPAQVTSHYAAGL